MQEAKAEMGLQSSLGRSALPVVWILLFRFCVGVIATASCAPTAFADEVKYLAHPQQSYAAFLDTIDQAKSSINIANFLIEPCDPSIQLLLMHLTTKVKQGVRVRMVIDDFEIPPEQKATLATNLATAGIELKFFNANPLAVNNRMHAKFMVVDDERLLLGGRNLGDKYFGLSQEFNYIDRDALTHGESAKQAGSAFSRLWSSPVVTRPSFGLPKAVSWRKFCTRLYKKDFAKPLQALDQYMKTRASEILQQIPARACQQTRFYLDHPSVAEPFGEASACTACSAKTAAAPSLMSLKQTTTQFLSFVNRANQDLVVENESYLPVDSMDASFKQLRSRRVPVTVLTNRDMDDGPGFFKNIMAVQMAKAAERDSLGSQQVGQLPSAMSGYAGFELTPKGKPVFIHSKVAVRDKKDVIIGSFNADGRSADINVESMIVAKNCPDLAGDVRREFEELRRSYNANKKAAKTLPEPEKDPVSTLLGDLFLPQL